MHSHAQAVIIGGGVTGCSIAYHLAKAGMSDVVLLERTELTAGSTWHAAGGTGAFGGGANASLLHKYSFELYPKLEAETGQSCGFHHVGLLTLARTDERVEELKRHHMLAHRAGIATSWMSHEEARQRAPILNMDAIKAVLHEPSYGHVDPNGVTQAFAKGARDHGARIIRQCPVLETRMRPDKTWDVVTTHGTIHAQSVVNAAGLWAREVAAKAGITLPLLPVEHHYLVTEAIAEIESLGFELPLIGDADSEYYMRQEGLGLLLGVYEDTCTHWAEDGTPPDFGHELLPNHLDRIERNLAQAMERVPVLAQVGIKRVINGPMIFSPDLNPLIGPYPGVPNYWCACGVMTGFSQSAAIGMVLAGWMTEREPPLDVFMWDVARYGSWAGKDYVRARTGDMYATRFKTLYPYEHRDAGRPTRTTDAYALQARRGAIFGANDGLEYPLWFARPGIEPRETLTFRRPNWFGPVGEECRALHASVAATDISTYGKHRVAGPGAFAWLQKIMANDMAEHDGDVVATPMLSHGGRLVGDFAVARLSAQDFVLIGSGEASRIHHRWWAQFLPCEGVSIESLTTSFGGMAVQGPRSREVMEALCRCDFSKEAWPEHRAAICKTGPVVNAILFSSSFTGETGFDVFVPRQTLLSLLEAILSTGMEFELSLAGARAMNSLRIEAGRGAWGTEYTPDFTPFEAGLNHLISGRKTGFVGCAAAMRDRHAPRYVLRRFEIDADDVDPWGDEPILNGEEVVGFLTSAAYGYRTSKSLALGYILPEKAEQTERLSIDILGDRRRIMVRNADTAGQARSVALGSIPAPLA